MWLKRSTMQTPSATRSACENLKRCEFSVNRAVHVDREPQARSRLSARGADSKSSPCTRHSACRCIPFLCAASSLALLDLIGDGWPCILAGRRTAASRSARTLLSRHLALPSHNRRFARWLDRKPGSLSTRNFDRQVTSVVNSCRRDPVSGERASSGATVGGP